LIARRISVGIPKNHARLSRSPFAKALNLLNSPAIFPRKVSAQAFVSRGVGNNFEPGCENMINTNSPSDRA
jgi:hypothetical protein